MAYTPSPSARGISVGAYERACRDLAYLVGDAVVDALRTWARHTQNEHLLPEAAAVAALGGAVALTPWASALTPRTAVHDRCASAMAELALAVLRCNLGTLAVHPGPMPHVGVDTAQNRDVLVTMEVSQRPDGTLAVTRVERHR